MPARKHALVKDSGDEDSRSIGLIEDDMFAVLKPPIVLMDGITGSAEVRVRREAKKALFQIADITIGLGDTPAFLCVVSYSLKILMSKCGETVSRQPLHPLLPQPLVSAGHQGCVQSHRPLQHHSLHLL